MRWTFWEKLGVWTFAIAALIEATDAALKNAPTLRQTLPEFHVLFAYAPLALVLVGAGIFAAIKFGWLKSTAPTAYLELRFNSSGSGDLPDLLKGENIWRWYVMLSKLSVVTAGVANSASITTLFVTFEPYVAITTLRCRSPDMTVPPYEVKTFNQRFAIIAFGGEMPKGTLQVVVGT